VRVPLRVRALLLGIGLGAAAGSALLGLGGRLAMRLFALATERPPAFTVRGTLVVAFAGAVAGALGGMLFWAVWRYLPGASWMRGLTFGALTFVIATPGIRPPRPLTFGLFAPLFLAYGLGLSALWTRYGAHARPSG
jgi:ABC-type amino acid transport substrate-binding protein